jgi:uncharacterized protein
MTITNKKSQIKNKKYKYKENEMKTKVLVAVGMVLILVLAVLAGCSSGGVTTGSNQPITVNMANQQTGIWVNGEGKVWVTPDLATLSLGIYSQKDKVSDAQSEAAAAMAKVMDALTSNGIEKKDIQTQNFSIQQVTRWDDKTQQQVVIGYAVTNMVVAKIRNLDKVGTIIDTAVSAGEDLIRINGISFTKEDTSADYVKARELAMNKAKSKAQQMTSLSGTTLGKPVYITESSYVPPVAYMTNSFKADMAGEGGVQNTSISPGELEITVNVQVNYAIQ